MTIPSRPLSSLTAGDVGIIVSVSACGALSGRLADIGCVVGSTVKMLGTTPRGSLVAIEIMDSVFALRKKDAEHILICPTMGGEAP